MLEDEEVAWLDQSEDTSEYSESEESEIDRENELMHELRTRTRHHNSDGTTHHFVAMLHNLISRQDNEKHNIQLKFYENFQSVIEEAY